jgi:hypothetical protein
MTTRQSKNSMAFMIAPPGLGGRDGDEVSPHESIVDHGTVVDDIKHADDKEDFALERETPVYLEFPFPPKKAHARLATPKAYSGRTPNSRTL